MQKGTCKGTMPLMLKSKMAAFRGLGFQHPKECALLSVLEE